MGSEGSFELSAALDTTRSLGRWPRSDADGVRTALAAAGEAARSWNATARGERRRLLGAAAEALEADREGLELLAARLGVEADELAPQLEQLARRVMARLDEPPAAAGIEVLVLDWTELLFGTAVAVLRTLDAGRVALVLPDARAPMAADRVAAALERAGVPRAAYGLVHGVGDGALAAAVAAPDVARVVASGSAARIERVRELATAGDGEAPELLLDVPGHRTVRIGDDDDAAQKAGQVVSGAFGRGPTLSGQLPGCVGSVVCAPRVLSGFSVALLEQLERSEDARRPVPLIDREALDQVQAAWNLGLDEGATLIHGGEVAAAGPRETRLSVLPTVFTNVEDSMELARASVPGPLLRLLRATSDEG